MYLRLLGGLYVVALLTSAPHALRLRRDFNTGSPALRPSLSMMMPPCYQELEPKDLANFEWCNPKYSKAPLPKKLQGLFWMQWPHENRRIEDVAVCMSLAEWDPTTRTMRFPQNYKQFIFKDSKNAIALVSMNQMTGMRYDFSFADDMVDGTVSRSKIDIFGKSGVGTAYWDALQLATTGHVIGASSAPMELNEEKDPSQPPGESWIRRTYIEDPRPGRPEYSEYRWVRIMDGDMNIRQERFQEMIDHFKKNHVTKIMHYWDKCPGQTHT